MNKEATFGIRPDLLIIIDVSPEKGLEKELDPDRFAAKGIDYHKKVNSGYLQIAKSDVDISTVIKYREGDVEGMQKEIRTIVKKILY